VASSGSQTIGTGAFGAQQRGRVAASAAATNSGVGAIQLLELTAGQVADTTATGDASLLLGAGVASNKNSIVVGDGQESHGNGSITAGGGFYGSGASITGITAAQVGAVSNNQTGVTLTGSFTATGGNVVTNGAIPGPGCKNFGASQDLTLDGLTVAYAARPSGVYTINVSRAASAGYCYVLTTYSTNSYVLGSGLVPFGTHTIGATNRFGFSPDTNGTYQVQQMRIQ
jgi:hypothetical protein